MNSMNSTKSEHIELDIQSQEKWHGCRIPWSITDQELKRKKHQMRSPLNETRRGYPDQRKAQEKKKKQPGLRRTDEKQPCEHNAKS
jgi:hypothetical protein